MSLTASQQELTKKELKENFELFGHSFADLANDLNCQPEYVEKVLNLQSKHIEDPWILKLYLDKKLKEVGADSIPYTALTGSPSDYWFLNQKRIQKGLLS